MLSFVRLDINGRLKPLHVAFLFLYQAYLSHSITCGSLMFSDEGGVIERDQGNKIC